MPEKRIEPADITLGDKTFTIRPLSLSQVEKIAARWSAKG